MKPPIARKEPKITKIHGYELTDDYYWMRDRDDEKSPEIIKYLEDENAYTALVMKPYEDLVDRIYNEIIGRIKQSDLSVPYKKGAYWYQTKTIEGKEYPVYLRSKTFEGDFSEIVLDQNELAEGYKFCSVRALSISDDGNFAAYLIDNVGYRQYTLCVKNLETGNTFENKIERVTSFTWSGDNNTIFFTTEDPVSKRSNKFYRHDLSANKSVPIFVENDLLFNIFCHRSRDGSVIFLRSDAATMDECRFVRDKNRFDDFKVIIPRSDDHEYVVDYYEGEFFITTNKNAQNFRIVRAPMEAPHEANWTEFIPHRDDVLIENLEFYKGFAAVEERKNGLEQIRVINMEDGSASKLEMPESAYTLNLIGLPDFASTRIRYAYASMITPNSVYEYDLCKQDSILLKQDEVLGEYDKNNYETVRVTAETRDGTAVPISILMKKGTMLDGSAPLHLYAYGSYGISMTPYFSVARLSLVDRGYIYAIAHIRGGSELGEAWRQDGRMQKKLNTFYDFIDCAKFLQNKGYSTPNRTTIEGGSAGGMLMGGVVNMSPETFRAAVVNVPFLDVINTMLDESLPLTTEEWIEWGNPNEKEAFDYMMRYSPYDNVNAQKYPNMLIQISLWDSQVPYWEGAKFAAKVRANMANDATILLKTNFGGGHGGSSGRYERYKEIAFEYAFLLSQVRIDQ
ncbi:MAG: S9 family peptidase [Pyrinomonadaceae bacterium]